MATREQIAKRAGKLAAIAAYNAVMHAPIKKTATLTGVKTQASLKDVAKAAAKGTYEGIISLADENTPISYDRNSPTTGQGASVGARFPGLASAYRLYSEGSPIPNDVLGNAKKEWLAEGTQAWFQANEPAMYNGLRTFVK